MRMVHRFVVEKRGAVVSLVDTHSHLICSHELWEVTSKITDKSGRNELPLKGDWALPYR